MCYLPVYSLFQSDRKNSDADSEVQDPLREAVREIIKEESLQKKLFEIADIVRERIKEVSSRTLSGDENIPINKRGSGVRRIILINFFRAEAERRAESSDNANVIYAIEEPETSQHNNNQYKLIKSLIDLSVQSKTQILITTHSPNIVKQLNFSDLRLIKDKNSLKTIENVEPGKLKYPSLNEVNYMAFGDATDEYHNELYGYIELKEWLSEYKEYKDNKKKIDYKKLKKNGEMSNLKLTLTEYIRHQIHHPENTNNIRFTEEQLRYSIDMMREFIDTKES